MHAFVSYSKIFAKVYVYTFLQNKSIDEIKATIQDIFKSMKETSWDNKPKQKKTTNTL